MWLKLSEQGEEEFKIDSVMGMRLPGPDRPGITGFYSE